MENSEKIIGVELRELRRRTRSLLVQFAIALSMTLTLGSLLLYAWMDYVSRWQSAVPRYVGFVALLSVVTFAIVTLVWPSIHRRISLLSVADALEGRFPSLRHRLTSAVSFGALEEVEVSTSRDDRRPIAGASSMKSLLIEQVRPLFEQLPRDQVLNPTPTRWAWGSCTLISILWIVWLAIDLSSSSLAVKRVVTPWSFAEWPQRNNLVFVALPEKIGRGSDLQVAVTDENRELPSPVLLDVRRISGKRKRTYEMNREARQASWTLSSLNEAIEIRVRGGDDQTAWHKINVASPPEIESFSWNVQPPSYTDLPPYQRDGDITAWVGSRLGLSGTADREIEKAELIITSNQGRVQLPLQLGDSHRQFSLKEQDAWELESSGSYLIRLTDADGVANPATPTGTIQALRDQPPTLEIQTRSYRQLVTPDAEVPWFATGRDDLKLQLFELVFKRDDTVWLQQTLMLDSPSYEVDSTDGQHDSATSPATLSVAGHVVEEQGIISLDAFAELQPGSQLLVGLRASDELAQTSELFAVPLRVVSQGEFLSALGNEEQRLAVSLNQAIQDVERASLLLRRITPRAANENASEDDSASRLAEGIQFQVSRLANQLGDNPGGAVKINDEIRTALQRNKLNDSPMFQRSETSRRALRAIMDSRLPQLQSSIAPWLTEDDPQADPTTFEDRRAGVAAELETIKQELTRLLDSIDQSVSLREVSEELLRLYEEQREFAESLQRLQLLSLDDSNSRESISRQLDDHLEQQTFVTRRFSQAIQRLSPAERGEVAQESPAAWQEIRELAERLGVEVMMRDTARYLEAERLGQAVSLQPPLLDAFEQLLNPIQRLLEKGQLGDRTRLEQANRQLPNLIEQHRQLSRQAELLQQQRAAGRQPTSDQLELWRTNALQFSQRLQQMRAVLETANANESAVAMRNAELEVQAAIDAADDDDEERIGRMRRAGEELAIAFESAQMRIQVLDQREFRQQFVEWIKRLAEIHDDAKSLTEQMQTLAGERESLADTEAARNARSLSRRFLEAAKDLELLSSERAGETAMRILLQRIVDDFRAGATDLANGNAQESQWKITQAMKLFDELVDNLKGSNTEPQQAESQADPETPTEEETPDSSIAVDLRAIRALQSNLLERTRALNALSQQATRSDRELIQRRQRELIDIQLELSRLVEALREELQSDLQDSAGSKNEPKATTDQPRTLSPPPLGGNRP